MPIVDVQPRIVPSDLLEIKQFGGINLAVSPSQIADNECVDILNFMISEAGKLKKRTGYKKVIGWLGEGNINGMVVYNNSFYFAYSDKLYKLTELETYEDLGKYTYEQLAFSTYGSLASVEVVYTGLMNNKTTFFQMDNKLYILDGINYLVYDGTDMKHVKDNAYIPLLFIACEPGGSGTEYEQWNLLGKKFRQRFTPDGVTKVFKLCFTNLDSSTPIRVTADDTTWVSEGNGFTVDRVKGEATFTTAPGKNTDNLTFEAGKDFGIDLINRIAKCTLYTLYGGNNDTRVILSGNSDTPSVIYRSGVYDPSYFPENYYQAVGNTGEKVTGFAIQYDYCVIFKEKSIWHMRFELGSNGVPSYQVRPLNDAVGCINPNTIQLIENAPFFLDKRGIYTITQSTVRDEKNVQLVSEKINYATFSGQIGLLQEPNLDKAISIDYDSKYMLCVNDKVYIFDYRNNCWYKWNNINAKCFIEYNNKLYFGDNNGNIYVFRKADEMQSYDDLGSPIKTLWKSKIFDFGADERRKLIEKIFFSMNTASRTSVKLYYITQENEKIFVDTTILDLFNYATFDYSRFTYCATPYPFENSKKIKAKKVIYFQIILENEEPNESLELLSLDIKWRKQNYVK